MTTRTKNNIFSNDRFQLSVLLIISFLIRLPFLNAGFGTDSDAWRVIRAAQTLKATGAYEVSRFPGFPVIEILLAPFSQMDPRIINGITVLFSLMMLVFLWLLFKEFKMKHRFLTVLTVSLTPIILKNSVITMDYLWALAFLMGGLYLTFKNKTILAGILFGLAVGCRASSVIFLLPALYLLYQSEQTLKLRKAIYIVSATIITGVICYIPVLLTYGFGFLQVYSSGYPPLKSILERFTLSFWSRLGIFPIVIFLLGLLVLPKQFKNKYSLKNSEILLRKLSFVVVLLYFVLFLIMPYESEYFIPAVPFIIYLFSSYLKRPLFIVFSIFIIAGSFFAPCKNGTICNGMVMQEFVQRKKGIYEYNHYLRDIEKIDHKAIVVCGWYYPKIQYYAPHYKLNNIKLIYLGTKEEFDTYEREGYAIYYLPGMDSYNMQVHGVAP